MSHRLSPAAAQALSVLRWTEDEARCVLDDLAASGLTCAEFARVHNVSAQRLYLWQRRFAATLCAPARDATPPVGFVEVHDPAPVTAVASRIDLVWPTGPTVRLEGRVDEDALRTVLRVVRERGPC